MVWSTEILNFIKNNDISIGFFTQSPFWKLNENIRKGFIQFNYTEEEITNLYNIQDIENFLPFVTDFKLRQYQKEILLKYHNNKFNCVAKSRQCGITLVDAIFALHYILTNTDKAITIICDKTSTAVEMIDKVKKLYCSLPFYMKPGVDTWNQSSISFDNGVRLKAVVGVNGGVGYQIHCLMIQEASFIPNFDRLYRSTFPIIASLKDAKLIISSTLAEGEFNNFYERIDKGMSDPKTKTNFTLSKVYWNQVEGRDEKWKNDAILAIGGIEAFEREYNLNLGKATPTAIDNTELFNDVDKALEEFTKEFKMNSNKKTIKKLNSILKKIIKKRGLE